MKNFKQLMREMMTSTGSGIAGMHQSITPSDNLPQIAGREADRIRVPKRKRKIKIPPSLWKRNNQ